MEKTISLRAQAAAARNAARRYQRTSEAERQEAVWQIGTALLAAQDQLLRTNAAEVAYHATQGLNQQLQDRLRLSAERIAAMADGVRQVAQAADPLQQPPTVWRSPDGLLVEKAVAPLGVVGMIYEARPNVTVDAAALCLKSGNAVLLRGSRLALSTNRLLLQIIHSVLVRLGLPADTVQLVQQLDHASVIEMVQLRGLLDAVIPRGGKELIATVVQQATVPVLETGVGNCHIFVDASAPVEMAIRIVLNAKCSRPSVCNAVETVLLHREWAARHFPTLAAELAAAGVELHLSPELLSVYPAGVPATEKDYADEFLDLALAIRQVDHLDAAIAHIADYGTKHSEAIITLDQANVIRFFSEVDAACLYHNASTRFSDGYALGLGAEIGISTQKLHARGPMGLEALTSYKYLIRGDGQTR